MKLSKGIGVLIGTLLTLALGARGVGAVTEAPKVVVGTFDSRGVAVAYVRSPAFGERLGALRAELATAEQEGNTARVDELKAMGPALQAKVHEQGFGTAPVDDILALIDDEIAGIAKRAGVDVIVSKWNLVYHSKAAKFVDVTGALVGEFDPDEETLEIIDVLLQKAPISPDELHAH